VVKKELGLRIATGLPSGGCQPLRKRKKGPGKGDYRRAAAHRSNTGNLKNLSSTGKRALWRS